MPAPKIITYNAYPPIPPDFHKQKFLSAEFVESFAA
jgi:hypothetical protein